MTYNSKHIRQPLLEAGELTLRWAQDIASVTSAVGLSLECQLDQPLCRLVVSDQHFAGTVGLLGVFDYDNSSDFMTSRWEMVSMNIFIIPNISVIIESIVFRLIK